MFYIYAFFSVLLYFVGRREGDYEILILGLINVVVATFLFVFRNSHISILLGAAMIIYTILVIINRGFRIVTLKKKESFMWVVKFVITFLIGILGILTSINLYTQVTVQTLVYGYYFLSLGFLMSIESVIELLVTEDRYKKLLRKVLVEEDKLEEIKPLKKEEVKLAVKEEVKPIVKEEVKKPVKKEVKKAPKKEAKKTVKKETKKKVTKTKKTNSTAKKKK